jgi:hypothetical protein
MAGSMFSQKWPATATFEALFSAPPAGLGVSLADVINGTNGWTKMRVHNDSPACPVDKCGRYAKRQERVTLEA